MKFKHLVAALAVALIATGAVAQNAVLQNEWVKAGVNATTGTFGSGGNTNPGLQYDGTGTGTFNSAYDYLTPGTPFDGFTVRIENSANALIQSYTNNNAGNLANIPGAWVGSTSSSSAVWEGSTSRFVLRNTYSLPSGQQYVDINTRITASESIDNLYFGRFIDPDARAAAGDSSQTDNVRGYGAIPRANVAFSEALASRYALGLYTGQTTGSYGAGISPGWSTNPKDYLNNTSSQDAVRGDFTIGLGFAVAGLSAGDIVNIRYAYIFGPSAFGAASSAVTGGAGGGTAGTTPSGGTLTDVGSATDASTSAPPVTTTPSAPTVTGTTTTNTVTHVNTAGTPVATTTVGTPVVTRTGLESVSVQATTVSTYTPITRTTTTTPVTVTTYSDSTTTTTSGSPVVTTSDVSTTSVQVTTTTVTESIVSGLPVIVASVAHHTPSEGNGKQTIARETTTTTTTALNRATRVQVVTDGTTTSDNTTDTLFNNVDVGVANDSFSGLIDQMAELSNLNTGINRYLNMNAFRKDGYRSESGAVYINANRMSSSMANGYSANSRIYGIALETNVDKNWRLGAQYNRVDTTMNGVDSTTTQGKNAAGLYSIYNLNDWVIVNNLGYAENGIASSRNVERLFYNSHTTSGTDIWLNNRVYTPSLSGFRPFVGYTVGQSTVNGYTERGSIQSRRQVGSTNTSTNYGEAGVLFDQRFGNFITAVEASTTTDSFTSATAVLGYAVDKSGTIAVTGTRQQYNGTGSNIVGVQGIFRF